jgi:thiamine-phosphate pyrophosphorylase
MARLMTSGRQATTRHVPRLYLVTQRIEDAGALPRALEHALDAADVAAVLLRLPISDETNAVALVQQVASTVQQADAALLIEDHPEIARRAGADGAHLIGFSALRTALPALKPDLIAGAGGLHTRHDAMLAGEAGADYVMFGEPDNEGRSPNFDSVLDRVGWWSELFEVPCIGFACSADEIEALAAAGADFVGVCDMVWSDPRGPAAAVASAAARLRAPESV